MSSRCPISRYFKKPPLSKIYQFDKQHCDDFANLLTQSPWKYKLIYGKHPKHGLCCIVNRPFKIQNTITTYPPEIEPYQAIFISNYGYLPKRKELRPRVLKPTKNSNTIRMRQKRQRQRENMEVDYMDFEDEQKQENDVNNRIELSHLCGKKACISIKHIIIEIHKYNIQRRTCHQQIKERAQSIRASQTPRPYRKGTLKWLEAINCNHNPTCFINFCGKKM